MSTARRIIRFAGQTGRWALVAIIAGLAFSGCGDPVEPRPADHLAYAVGDSGVVLGFDGSDWNGLPGTGTDQRHEAIWGVSPTEVYVAGWWDGMLRVDGEDATGMETGLPDGVDRVSSLWGTSGSDIWGVGTHNTLVHFDGTRWSRTVLDPSTHLYGVWGSARDEVFAVGERVWRFDGSAWTEMEFPRMDQDSWPRRVMDVWGTSSTDVFGVGWAGFYHYDGTAWTRMPTPFDDPDGGIHPLAAIAGTSSNDVFAVDTWGNIFHYDGAEWSLSLDAGEPGTGDVLVDIAAASPTDVYAVGHHGVILHYDGGGWTRMKSGTEADLHSVWTP